MKREGRQHGMVRCHHILPDALNPRAGSIRYLNRFDSPSTAGLFTRVPTKPTNHSKFTGKCGRPRCRACHDSPVQKSKDKRKGAQKERLVTWRVSEAEAGSKLYGFSATGLLDQMDGEDCAGKADEVSCEIGSLDENDEICDSRDHDENKGEMKGYDDEKVETCDEDEDWYFVEETL